MKLTDDIIKEKLKIAFWNTMWAKITLVGALEVFFHSLIVLLRPEPSSYSNAHLIFWAVFLIVTLIIRYKKEWSAKP